MLFNIIMIIATLVTILSMKQMASTSHRLIANERDHFSRNNVTRRHRQAKPLRSLSSGKIPICLTFE
ncbi:MULTISPECIES: hypothetical protein [Bartonella]|uniref:hypothetical protein n=1 Tax=Bartonella TaxID=773 RepID=UPI0018DD379B|nr:MULTISPECIES: hypothetical protein [Bartonella]MBH9974983.1 hypothetical protein [Bartonella choladocola]MBI0014589.1 hypothetical protein [Bartonella sp. B10834G3]